MTEVWKPVVGWEDLYEVSDAGRVRSLGRPRPGTYVGARGWSPRILKQAKGAGRTVYLFVGLSRNKVREYRYVHSLVLEAFVGPRPEGMQACHGNCDSSDNTLSNLRWASQKDNAADSMALRRHTHGPRQGSAKLSTECVARIRDIRRFGIPYHKIAAWFGVSTTQVGKILRGEQRVLA